MKDIDVISVDWDLTSTALLIDEQIPELVRGSSSPATSQPHNDDSDWERTWRRTGGHLSMFCTICISITAETVRMGSVDSFDTIDIIYDIGAAGVVVNFGLIDSAHTVHDLDSVDVVDSVHVLDPVDVCVPIDFLATVDIVTRNDNFAMRVVSVVSISARCKLTELDRPHALIACYKSSLHCMTAKLFRTTNNKT